MDSSVNLFKCKFICHLSCHEVSMPYQWTVQVSSATVFHVRHTSALVCQSNLSLCLCPVRTKEEALLQPFMARSHPPRTQASMTNTILGHDDHSWINGCDGDDFDDIDIVIIVRSYTKKWNLDNFAQGSYLCEAYLNPCTSVSTWIATNQFGSKLGHDIWKLERHMQLLVAS